MVLLRNGLIALVLAGMAAGVAAEDKPASEPQLRIEAGMHTATIKRIDVSADGKLLATGSDDKTVRLWSLPEGRPLRVLRVPVGSGNEGKVYAVAMSPDGRVVAAGGWFSSTGKDEFVHLFDAGTGALVHRLGPMPNPVNHLAFSTDGMWLAAGLWGGSGVRIWDTKSGKLLAQDGRYRDDVDGLAFDRSRRLAVTSFDGLVRLYGGADFRLVKKVSAPSGARPSGISFSPDGSQVAVGYLDGVNVGLDVLSDRDLSRLFPAGGMGVDNGDLSTVAWSGNGHYLYAAGPYASDGNHPILRWSDGGRGAPSALPAAVDTVFDLKPWGPRGVAYGAADPAFGMIDGSGVRALHHGPLSVDMRNKLGDSFLVSADARRVRFGIGAGDRQPWLFDLSTTKLAPSLQIPAGLRSADVDSIPVADWKEGLYPKIRHMTLKLRAHEIAHSLAVLPGRDGFILGAHFSLRRFDAEGKQIWEKPVPGAAGGVNLSADGRILIVAYQDGTIRWHRSSDGEELLALFIHVPEDEQTAKRWVLWTPKGYYTASPGGEELIGWHINRGPDQAPDFFPAAQFRDQFYRPDIVRAVLEALDEDQAIDRANAAANRKRDEKILRHRPPLLTVVSPRDGAAFANESLRVYYLVRSPSGLPIRRVRVLIDGVPAAPGERAKGFVPAPAPDRDIPGRLAIKLPGRDVTLSLIAETENAESKPAVVNLRWTGRRPEMTEIDKPVLYALVVGIGTYRQDNLHLKFAAKDARDVVASLRRQKGGPLYRDVIVTPLLDDQATERAVRLGLDRIKRTMTAKDAALVFFSGHGVTLPDQSTYLITYDVDPDATSATALNERLLIDQLKRFPGKTLVFLDACQSAGGLEGFGFKSTSKFDTAGVLNDFLKTAPGVVTFASSLGSQSSAERDDLRNGIFTSALLEGLSGKADVNGDGVIQTVELDWWLTQRVKQLSRGYQDAIMLKPETMRHFPVAVVRP
jgi:hypothetical protein